MNAYHVPVCSNNKQLYNFVMTTSIRIHDTLQADFGDYIRRVKQGESLPNIQSIPVPQPPPAPQVSVPPPRPPAGVNIYFKKKVP